LNDNVVDINQAPLEDYEIGMDDGNGKEGNGDDVKVIDEGVFDASQPTQRKRTMNYTDMEDACLVRAWENV
jgi:hypothetical protein